MNIMRRALLVIASLSLIFGWSALTATDSRAAKQSSQPRPLAVNDYFEIGDVGDPQISPGGRWIASP